VVVALNQQSVSFNKPRTKITKLVKRKKKDEKKRKEKKLSTWVKVGGEFILGTWFCSPNS
jgi:hypothetical protein